MQRLKIVSPLNRVLVRGHIIGVTLVVLLVLRLNSIDVSRPRASYDEDSVYDIQGTVQKVVSYSTYTRIDIIADFVNRKKSKDTFRVYSYNESVRVGDVIMVVGIIKNLPNDSQSVFGERRYAGMVSYPHITVQGHSQRTSIEVLFNTLQKRINAVTNVLLPEPHASLLVGIVFGIERHFESDFYDALKRTGVLHIVVASGFNAVIVSQLVITVSSFLRKEFSVLFTVFVLVLYAGIAGFQIPIVRAVIMTCGQLLAHITGEYREGLRWLFISAYLLLLYNPLWIVSPSFQLSFMASLGLLLIGSIQINAIKGISSILQESFVTTVVAQVFTLPVMLYHFGTVSWKSVIVNTLVLETVPLVMGWGALCIFIEILSHSFALLAIQPVWLLLEYFRLIVVLVDHL